MKKSIAFLLIVLMAFSFSACTLTNQSSLKFKPVESGYALYRYKGVSTQRSFEVPETYEDQPVTQLMGFSLANAEYLESIYISKNVREIDVWALTNCPLLKEFTVDERNEWFTAVDGVLYSKDMTQLIAYPNGKTPLQTDPADKNKVTDGGRLVLPETVKEIRANAVYLCNNLYDVTFNEGLEKIGDKAFLKCGNLSRVELPGTLQEIGVDAFSYCNTLTQVEIPASVQSIGDFGFFSTASSLKKIIIHKGSADEIQLGKDWIPSGKGGKVAVEFVG